MIKVHIGNAGEVKEKRDIPCASDLVANLSGTVWADGGHHDEDDRAQDDVGHYDDDDHVQDDVGVQEDSKEWTWSWSSCLDDHPWKSPCQRPPHPPGSFWTKHILISGLKWL